MDTAGSDTPIGRPRLSRVEVLALVLVVVVANWTVPVWVWQHLMPHRTLVRLLGEYSDSPNSWDCVFYGVAALLPLLLCLTNPSRSGFRIGVWKPHTLRVAGVCLLPVVLTLIVYPLTSRPFTGWSAAIWLVVPVREEMIFTGYIYGLFDATFPETVTSRIPVRRAVLLTAVFFSLWHTPNFVHMAPAYVLFQLLYTLLGGAWVLLARQWTGSILPGVATHMAVNFIAWKGW